MWRVLLALLLLLAVVLVVYGRASLGIRPFARAEVPWQPTATITPSAPQPTASNTPTTPPSPTPEPTATPAPPPHLVAGYPVDGDLAVRAAMPLTLVFDRPLDRASLEATWSIVPAVEGEIAWPAETTVSFAPNGGWAEGEYTLHIAAGLCALEAGCTDQTLTVRFGVGGRGVPVPVLMYHRVLELAPEATDGQRTWTVAPSAFREQMEYLLAHGYRSVGPNDLADYMHAGRPLPRRPVIITLDDGSIDVYTTVYPLLKDTPLRPVLFLIPSHMVGYGAYLDWSMARELSEAGFRIGVHSYDHISLRGLSDDELRVQVQEAKTALEEGLGVTLDSFSYPLGAYDERMQAALQRYGYRTAFTINPSVYHSPDEPYLLSRLRVSYDTTLEKFAELLPW